MKKKYDKRSSTTSYILILLLSLTMVGCGGGSSGSDDSTDNDTESLGEDTGSDTNDTNDSEPDTNDTSDTESGTDTDTDGDDRAAGGGDPNQDDQAIGGSFFRTDQLATAAQIQGNFVPGSDSCLVTDSVFDITNPNIPDIEGLSNGSISAGEVITVTSPTGTFAELVRQDQDGFISYEPAGNLPGAIPAGTVIDIPGDDFPAFSNVAVPMVAALTNVEASTGDSLEADSTITWGAGSDSNSTLSLSASVQILPDFTDPNFDITNFDPTLEITSINCTIVDDGNFSFPASIRSQLGDGFSANSFSLTRDGVTFEQNGNAFLAITSSSGN